MKAGVDAASTLAARDVNDGAASVVTAESAHEIHQRIAAEYNCEAPRRVWEERQIQVSRVCEHQFGRTPRS